MIAQQRKGFTIIEVVLVLAIAGLIFLMVFIALPALQRGQRDNQRKSDTSHFVSQLQSYATNNRGSLPTDANIESFRTSYLHGGSKQFVNPQTGDPYTITATGSAPTADNQFVYRRGGTCNGETITVSSSPSPRQAAVAIRLEGGGVMCQQVQQG